MTWFNHWYQWRFAHYCIIALSAPTFNSHSLNRLSQHPQLPSLIRPWANTTTPRDTSRKGCASPVPAEVPSSGLHAGKAEGMAVDYAWRMRHTSHHQPHPKTQWWVAGDGGGHQCPAPATCTAYPSGCAVFADGACTQTLVLWTIGQGQPERRHVTHESGTLPVRASSWCSRDGVFTRLAGKVQRPARDQVISSFWG